MTQMSDTLLWNHAPADRNRARSQARSRLARALHRSAAPVKAVGLALVLAASACVIPPSLSVGAEDAAVNSPPAITSVRVDGQEFTPPGPLKFNVADTPTMTIDVIDTDLGDTLYVRLFVDYNSNNELDARSKCVAPPAADKPSAQRTATCDLRSLCVSSDAPQPGLNPHDLSIVVFDREPLDSGTPAFQAMPPGGLSTSVYYHLNCVPAT